NNYNMTLYIPLQDVDNQHCAMIVQNGLKDLSDIDSLNIEINNQRAVVETEKPEEILPKAVQIIRDLGYNVPTLVKTIPVMNLSCASCAGITQAVLNNRSRVVKAEVDYAHTQAKNEFISSLTSTEKLTQAVQAAGYDLIID